jgi:single-strand DNA-binding protein
VATDNQVTLVGNLTDDPELRFTPNGAAVANFRLAVTPRVREGDSWKDGETSFFRINVWRQMAENVAESMTKGSRAVVVGRLRTRSWETPEGEKRSVTEVEADEVAPSLKFATAKVERSSRGGGGGSGGGGGGGGSGGGEWSGDSASGSRSGGQFNDEPPF